LPEPVQKEGKGKNKKSLLLTVFNFFVRVANIATKKEGEKGRRSFVRGGSSSATGGKTKEKGGGKERGVTRLCPLSADTEGGRGGKKREKKKKRGLRSATMRPAENGREEGKGEGEKRGL